MQYCLRLLKGPDAIKPLFEALISEFAKPGSSFTMQLRCIEGDHAYILWTAETADNSLLDSVSVKWRARGDSTVAFCQRAKEASARLIPPSSLGTRPSGYADRAESSLQLICVAAAIDQASQTYELRYFARRSSTGTLMLC